MKRLCALFLATVLLVGCGSLNWKPSKQVGSVTLEIPSQPTRETVLRYWLEPGTALPESLTAYAQSREIALVEAETEDQAAVAVLSHQPEEGYYDLSTETLLMQGAENLGCSFEEGQQGMPIAMGGYGYRVNAEALSEMLDGADALADLQAATYAEWEKFVTIASSWMARHKSGRTTLNGKEYIFVEGVTPATEALDDVFAVDCRRGFGSFALAPAFAAAGNSLEAETLIGPLNSAWALFELETSRLATCGRGSSAIQAMDAATAETLFREGKALFLRAPLVEGEPCLPMKFSFDKTDIAPDTDWTLDSLSQAVVLAPSAWVAVPQGQDEEQTRQGLGYLLWLYTASGSPLQEQQMQGVSPLNVTPEQEAALNQALTAYLSEKQWTRDLRTEYIENVLLAVDASTGE